MARASQSSKRQALAPPMVRAKSNIKDKDLLLERRAHLVDVATRVLIERGYNSVSVNELAEEAGISVGSLYKYVRSKQDVLWLVLDSIYTPVEAAIGDGVSDKDPVERFREIFSAFLRAVHSKRRGMLLMYREFAELPEDFQREFENRDRAVFARLEELIQAGNDKGVWKANPRLAAVNLYAASDAWTLKRWLLKDLTIDDYVEEQTRLMLAMLGVE